MKKVYFRGVNYDALELVKLASKGQLKTVPTTSISTISSCKAVAERIAVLIDGKHHLLTGMIDAAQTHNQITLLTLSLIAPAQSVHESYADRRRTQFTDRDHTHYLRMSRY